jgi:hypothetical protein
MLQSRSHLSNINLIRNNGGVCVAQFSFLCLCFFLVCLPPLFFLCLILPMSLD